jgi:hypothetical protein
MLSMHLKKQLKTDPKSDFYVIVEILNTLRTGQALINVLNIKRNSNRSCCHTFNFSKAVMGPLSVQEAEELIKQSDLFAKYGKAIDTESAHEILSAQIAQNMEEQEKESAIENEQKEVKKTRKEKSC